MGVREKDEEPLRSSHNKSVVILRRSMETRNTYERRGPRCGMFCFPKSSYCATNYAISASGKLAERRVCANERETWWFARRWSCLVSGRWAMELATFTGWLERWEIRRLGNAGELLAMNIFKVAFCKLARAVVVWIAVMYDTKIDFELRSLFTSHSIPVPDVWTIQRD